MSLVFNWGDCVFLSPIDFLSWLSSGVLVGGLSGSWDFVDHQDSESEFIETHVGELVQSRFVGVLWVGVVGGDSVQGDGEVVESVGGFILGGVDLVVFGLPGHEGSEEFGGVSFSVGHGSLVSWGFVHGQVCGSG